MVTGFNCHAWKLRWISKWSFTWSQFVEKVAMRFPGGFIQKLLCPIVLLVEIECNVHYLITSVENVMVTW